MKRLRHIFLSLTNFRLKCIEVRLMDGTDKFGGIATLATFSVSAYRVGTSDAALHKHGRRKNQPNGRTLRRTCSRLVPAEPDRFIGYFCLVQSLPVKDRCLYSGLVSFSFPYPDASGKEIHKVIRGAMALSCCWLIAYNSPLATAPSPLIYKKPASRVTTELLCVRRDRGTRDPSSPH